MTQLLVAALGLGIAGLDPAGALIAVGALSIGARERDVMLYAVVSILGTAVLGTVLSLTVGQQLRTIRWASLLPPDRLAALFELLIAVGLSCWAVARVRRPGAHPPKPPGGTRTGTAALLGLGILWAAAAVLDPTYVGLVVLAGRQESIVTVAAAHLLWILISQVPLVLVAIAIARGRHERTVALFNHTWSRVRPVAAWLGTGALFLAAAVFAADALWWFASERFLIPIPA
ncbi:hypothetical protein [Kribbella catacumbae]|uniref:hypothetical protein n=1 Tax=Kribbella catacumbae TaxID=460086 RepID=UPI00036072BF|nr:hypothetical protein [Kribbella catacumbae]